MVENKKYPLHGEAGFSLSFTIDCSFISMQLPASPVQQSKNMHKNKRKQTVSWSLWVSLISLQK